MAEFVQHNIEGMIPELEQMERVGLFTGPETRQILKKRKGFEYKLQRKTKKKDDILQYIQYETNVLALLKKRRQNIGYTFKKLEIDNAISQRIHKLFRLATYRFQDDVKLWLSHVQFSKTRKEKTTISKLFTQMLQVHNRKPDLWIGAAKWEFEENMNHENARHMLQKGIRFNPSSKQLWLEYYRMELLFAEKLRKRKQIVESELPDEEDVDQDAVLAGSVAAVVYKQAMQEFPDDVIFALSFLPICQLFDFAKNQEKDIFSDIQKCFPDRPETFDAIARQHIHTASTIDNMELKEKEIQKCYDVYQEAVTKMPGGEIWDLYMKACLDLIEMKLPKKTPLPERRIHKLLAVFEEAVGNKAVTPDMFEKWVDVLANVGLVKEQARVYELATTHHPKIVSLWKQRLQVFIRTAPTHSQVVEMFHTACNQVPKKKSLPLWQLVLDYCIANKSDLTNTLFEKGVNSHRTVSGPVKVLYLQWTYMSAGISQTRDLYKRFMQAGLVPLQLIQEYIKMEMSQAKPKMKLLRQAYEDAVTEFGSTDTDLWINYIQLEQTHPQGKPEEAGTIHFRAVKCLEGDLNQQFITKYTLLQTGHLDA
ncbi:U3 small nucleolar RNA-associated protein 6 homolog [Ylistrum balloti]|uniref:U3 small nucleolar RNA-associated protein 6 homolog n=1 Tax=Ylistrum balloti TaxID=509963 RepID=UPI002905C903|nr:U3 small nucleolar RNA-associated protein 6 homolog [Ylistrum balloti]